MAYGCQRNRWTALSSAWRFSSGVGRVVVGVAEQLDEPFDPRIPEAFVAAQPVVGARQRSRVDAAIVDAPADGAFHEPGSFERLDVLRCRGERHPIWRRELADGVLTLGKSLEHGPPGLVTECAVDEVEPRVIMFNHAVEDNIARSFVNRLVE